MIVGGDGVSPPFVATEGNGMPFVALDCSVPLLLIELAIELVVLFGGWKEPWKELMLDNEENGSPLPSLSAILAILDGGSVLNDKSKFSSFRSCCGV